MVGVHVFLLAGFRYFASKIRRHHKSVVVFDDLPGVNFQGHIFIDDPTKQFDGR